VFQQIQHSGFAKTACCSRYSVVHEADTVKGMSQYSKSMTKYTYLVLQVAVKVTCITHSLSHFKVICLTYSLKVSCITYSLSHTHTQTHTHTHIHTPTYTHFGGRETCMSGTPRATSVLASDKGSRVQCMCKGSRCISKCTKARKLRVEFAARFQCIST